MKKNYYTIESAYKRIKSGSTYLFNVYYDGEGFLMAETDGPADKVFRDAGYECAGGYEGGIRFMDFVDDCEFAVKTWNEQQAA